MTSSSGMGALDLQAVIGFSGGVTNGLLLHPDNKHVIFPLGCTVVVRNVVERSQWFLHGHDNRVNCITIDKSGKLLASGQKTFMGFPADVIIWDFEQRREIHRLSLHKVCVSSLSFSCGSKYLASLGGRDDNSIVVWDVKTGTPICGSPAATDTAHAVTFFNQSELHIMTGGNYHIRLWQLDLQNKKVRPTNVNTGQLKRVVTTVLLSEDDSVAYCGTQTGDMMEVNVERALYKRLGPHKECYPQGVTCLQLIPGTGDILVGAGDGTLTRVNCKTLKPMAKCSVLGAVKSLAVTGCGTHLFVGTSGCNIYWADTASLTVELRNTCHADRINKVVFPHGFSDVFGTVSESDLRLWNAKTRQELLRLQVPNTECYCMVFTRDGHFIVTGWSDGKIRCFLPQSGRLVYAINDAHKSGVTALSLSSDSSMIVSGGMEGEIRMWGVHREFQSLEASLKEHRGRVWEIQMKADDSLAVSASSDGSCIVWDLTTKTRTLCLFESTMFKSVVYYPDESQLLTTGSDRKVAYWDTFDGQATRVLEGSEEAELCSLCMANSGSNFATGGVRGREKERTRRRDTNLKADRLVRIWDYEEGICKFAGVGHSGVINSVSMSPDQSLIVSVGDFGEVFMWKVPPEIVKRCNMTPEELANEAMAA